MSAPSLAELAMALPPGAVVTDPDVMEAYRRDQARTVPAGRPAAVVRAKCTAEVSAVLRWAHHHLVPVVPRGAGSGLTGGANAVDGGVVLDLTPMDRILELDPVEQLAVVQPGVVNADLSRAAAPFSLCYPPDPASREFSTLGGNLATNAGGLCCLILTTTLSLGGTIAGEHGIGLLKRHRLPDELGATALAVQQAIKESLDPRGILNPGKG